MITKEYVAKIEGHGVLHIDWEKNKAKLEVIEGERLFEGMLVNRTAEEAHWITPRICGICPVAHNIASVKAIEDALGIIPNQTTVLLRDLIMTGQMIQSHVLHLFFLVLPDYVGFDRGTELAAKDPISFEMALSLKEMSDEIVFLVGGRSVHPVTTTIGGFHKIPSKQSLEKILEKIRKTEKAAQKTLEIFSALNYPELKVEVDLIAQKQNDILTVSSLLEKNSKIKKSSIKNYKKDFEEEIKNYSTAKFAKYKGREILTGSLARLALDSENYKETVGGAIIEKIDFANPFFNNFAQAVEVLHFHKKAAGIIEKLLKIRLDQKISKPKNNPKMRGIGAVEAPRGGLYHEFHLKKDGAENFITYANIITPTVQNLTSIEKSSQLLFNQTKNRSQKERQKLIKMLIRAYDPCITCSVH